MERQSQLDYDSIARDISHASIIGIGESTHGTHEFFESKAEIFKRLVIRYGFNTLFFESIDDHCEAINNYLQTGIGNLEMLVNRLFYVYRTREVLDLLSWLRERHDERPVSFIGIDERKYVDDYAVYDHDKYNLRDKRMAEVVKRHMRLNPESKCMIWAHDAHVATFQNIPEWGGGKIMPMGEHLRSWFDGSYYSIAQLFGSGYFSASLIEGSGAYDNSLLVRHYARKPSKYFWENRLAKNLSHPIFLEGPRFEGLIKEGEVHYKRALGWGVERSVMHDDGNVTYVDISKAYNGLIFFPRTTASHLLRQN